MSLTYQQDAANSPSGKTTDDTDTFRGRFAELVPDEKIVWVVKFESESPDFAGEMRVTWSLADASPGTEVTVICEHIHLGFATRTTRWAAVVARESGPVARAVTKGN